MNGVEKYGDIAWEGSLPTESSTIPSSKEKIKRKIIFLESDVVITEGTAEVIETIMHDKLFQEDPSQYMKKWSKKLKQSHRYCPADHSAYSFVEQLFQNNQKSGCSIQNGGYESQLDGRSPMQDLLQ